MRIGNWPLLFKVLEHVIKHPDEYNQNSYVNHCGTTRCIAGWTVKFAGYVDGNHSSEVYDAASNELFDVEDAALLALDADQAVDEQLFGMHLTLDQILGSVADYARADGVTPTPLIVAEMFSRGVISERTWN